MWVKNQKKVSRGIKILKSSLIIIMPIHVKKSSPIDFVRKLIAVKASEDIELIFSIIKTPITIWMAFNIIGERIPNIKQFTIWTKLTIPFSTKTALL